MSASHIRDPRESHRQTGDNELFNCHLDVIRQNFTCSSPAYQVEQAKCPGISGLGGALPGYR